LCTGPSWAKKSSRPVGAVFDRPGQMPKTRINCSFGFANDIPAEGQAGDRRSPLQAYNGVLGGTCRGGLRPPARGKCPKRILIARSGLLTIFRRMNRRATTGRPYRLTTGFWVVLRCLARPEQMPKTHINCPFWFANDIPANEPAGDRRSPLQAYNGVSGGTCRGGLRPPARGKCPKRILIARSGLLTIFRRMNRRATTGRPYRLTTGFRVVLVGAVFDRQHRANAQNAY
jgi:hypothetical protein